MKKRVSPSVVAVLIAIVVIAICLIFWNSARPGKGAQEAEKWIEMGHSKPAVQTPSQPAAK